MAEFYPPWDDRSGMGTPEIRAMERAMLQKLAKSNAEEWERKKAVPELIRRAIPLPWVRR